MESTRSSGLADKGTAADKEARTAHVFPLWANL